MVRHSKSVISFILLLLIVGFTPLRAQWAEDGNAVCTGTYTHYDPQITANGTGGVIIAWYDNRSGNWDIYAQQASAWGAMQWTAGGVAICTASNGQELPTIVSDGTGGGNHHMG